MIHAHILITVLPENWLMIHNLATKRIYAHVRNSEPDPFTLGGGFATGFFEGERALILSGEREDAIQVHIRQRVMTIPGRNLFPEMPTSKGQVVVIISDDRAGEVFLTQAPNEHGVFPLVRRGRGNKKVPVCSVEQKKLARCDVK